MIFRRRALAAATASVALLALTACSSEEAIELAAAVPAALITPTAAPAPGIADFCTGYLDRDAAFIALGGGTEAEAIAVRPAYDAALDTLTGTAPAELAADVGVIAEQTRKALDTGRFAIFDSADLLNADARVDEFARTNCGFLQLQLAVSEAGLAQGPSSLPAGPVALTLSNTTNAGREVRISRIADAVTVTAMALLEMTEEVRAGNLTFAGFAYAEPGKSETSFYNLGSGRYLVEVYGEDSKPEVSSAQNVAEFTVR
ncbi:MAG: hypothetical protein ACT4P1_15175 [Sporichthyaceae bacterium]